MKNCGNASTQTASEPMNESADAINSSSIDLMNSDVLRNENFNCQPFSMRGYVAEKRNVDPNVCIPLDGITENRWEQLRGSLDVPHFRWWRCRSCVRELVTSTTTAQESSLELIVEEGSLKKNNTKPPAKDINMVTNIGEREIPYTVSLELLASAAAEMTSDQPQPLKTFQASNAEEDSSFERKNSGFGNDATMEEDDEALIVFTDVIDSEDERKIKKTRPMKELIWIEEKASAGKGVKTHTLQQTEERPSSSKGNNIHSEVQGQEFVRAQGSRKAKRSSPFLPDTNPISSNNAKATGSFCQPLLSRNRKKSNARK